MTEGFRWCPHCRGPHSLHDRVCSATGQSLDASLHRTFHTKGQVLGGRYELTKQIGAGGVGRVFEAYDRQAERQVAIKLIANDAPGELLVRLEREAGLVAELRHPNICAVYDVGKLATGAPFVVFERLFGETLAERTRGVLQLPVELVVGIFSQILDGIEVAHHANILHRDLKPQNVFLVDRPGPPLVKVLDFGFACDLTANSQITRPGKACGTLQYMSPEQLLVNVLDVRSDIFAIGVMLYEVLAGRHPFRAASRVELQTNILRAAPTPLRVRRPDISEALAACIHRALARDPADRQSSALEMNRELRSVDPRGLPTLAADDGPVSSTEPSWVATSSVTPPAQR